MRKRGDYQSRTAGGAGPISGRTGAKHGLTRLSPSTRPEDRPRDGYVPSRQYLSPNLPRLPPELQGRAGHGLQRAASRWGKRTECWASAGATVNSVRSVMRHTRIVEGGAATLMGMSRLWQWKGPSSPTRWAFMSLGGISNLTLHELHEFVLGIVHHFCGDGRRHHVLWPVVQFPYAPSDG